MFTRARLHLTLAYAALLGITVALVAGAIGLLAVREARSTDDRELKIRATAVLAGLPEGGPPPLSVPPSFARPPDGFRPRNPAFEQLGLLEWVIPEFDGTLATPPGNELPGLPDIQAAQRAAASHRPGYSTLKVDGSEVRIYSLPDVRTGQTEGVVQIARSRYFVNADVADLALIALAAGGLGLVLSAAAGYWLAGRTLRPIAVALEHQRNFTADASHELRTPLSVMLTNAELLTRHPDRPLADYQDVVEDLVAEIQRLSRLVTDLLTLARSDEAGVPLEQKPVSLSEIARLVGHQFSPLAAAQSIELRIAAPGEVGVAGDRDRLQQLAVILVDNALRYTKAGAISVNVARHGGDALLEVVDTGSGIAPDQIPHLFERFYRTDAARSSEEGGSGLGLALAKWIAESHGGRIDVQSRLGQGSVFTVVLPAWKEPAERRRSLRRPRRARAAAPQDG